MISTRKFAIAETTAVVASIVGGVLITGNVLAGTVNTSEAIGEPAAVSPTLTATDQAVLELLNNATTAVNNGNNTQAIFDVIRAVELEHTLRTTTATANQTAEMDVNVPNPLQ